jgi:hypothetical protein
VRGFNGAVSLKEITNYGDAEMSPSTVTMSGGSWSGSVTVYRVDETSTRGAVLYAWLPAIPSKDGTSEYFNVHPGPVARVQVVLPGQFTAPATASGLIGTPSSEVSGQPFVLRLLTTDNWWNPVYTDHYIRVTSSDPAGTMPAPVRMDHASATAYVTLRTVGTQTLTGERQLEFARHRHDDGRFPRAAERRRSLRHRHDSLADHRRCARCRDHSRGGQGGQHHSHVQLRRRALRQHRSRQHVARHDHVQPGHVVGPRHVPRRGRERVVHVLGLRADAAHGNEQHVPGAPGAFRALQVLLPGESIQPGSADGKTGAPVQQSAGTAFTVTVRAVDAYWNLVPTVSDHVRMGSTDAFASLPADTALVNGQVLFRRGSIAPVSSASGRATRRPRRSSPTRRPPCSSGAARSRASSCSRPARCRRRARPRAARHRHRSVDQLFVHGDALATDTWFNPVGGITDRVHLACDDPMATLPADQTMVDGKAELSLRLARGGYNEITATDVSRTGVPASATQVRAISSGFHLEAQISPATARAGEPFTLTVHVTNDAGSVIQEINSFVTLDVQNASSRASGRGSLLTAQFQLLQGQRSISETYTFAEPIVIVAHDDAGNAPATTNAITITPGQPSKIALTSDPSWVGGNKHALVNARLLDDFDNGVPDQAMTFQLTLGSGTLTPIDAQTDSAGSARADFQGPRSPETDRVHADVGRPDGRSRHRDGIRRSRRLGGHGDELSQSVPSAGAGHDARLQARRQRGVTIRIFTQTGELVREEHFDRGAAGGVAGLNGWEWDGKNGAGKLVASGGYVVFIEAQGNGETLHVMRRKIAVVR